MRTASRMLIPRSEANAEVGMVGTRSLSLALKSRFRDFIVHGYPEFLIKSRALIEKLISPKTWFQVRNG